MFVVNLLVGLGLLLSSFFLIINCLLGMVESEEVNRDRDEIYNFYV